VSPTVTTCAIAAVATGGVVTRPWRLPEAVWPVVGATLLVALGLLPLADAWRGIAKGTDVYLFLTGMMLLAELARAEGLFDWLACHAARWAHGSATRLFDLIYLVAIAVTVVLSNDATAVVLTPAVAAVARAARVERPLPYLFICALIANAASFVLPISNPANLVIYGSHMPPLLEWLPRFALPSLLAIGATYVALRFTQRRALRQPISADIPQPDLTPGGHAAAIGILATATALLAASALNVPLGAPTLAAATLSVAAVCARIRRPPWPLLRHISWNILPLVAGLFVLVEALARVGVVDALSTALHTAAVASPARAAWASGTLVALSSNAMNNLPAALIAGTAANAAGVSPTVLQSVLIGADLGPNLSVTGSLATILWLTALRRDGHHVSAWTFLKLGLVVMPPALILALAATILLH
jgi:arsenical pump membrane protein